MSLRSTSMRACNLPSPPLLLSLAAVFPAEVEFNVPSSSSPDSIGQTLALLNMGNSSPRLISVMRTSPSHEGFRSPLRSDVREPRTAASAKASALNCAIVCATSTLNQSNDSGWWPETL